MHDALLRGAKADVKGRGGRAPVTVAASLGHAAVLEKILERVTDAGRPVSNLSMCASLLAALL